jgi:hypothetical protein
MTRLSDRDPASARAALAATARRRFLLHSAALIGAALLAPRRAGAEELLTRIDDLRELAARVRRERVPIAVLFSLPGCPYCLEVRRSYLAPRVREGAPVIVREVDITSSRSLIDLDGRRITETELAARFNVRVTPVVLLLDGDLRPLAEPLVGIVSTGFYEANLQSAIDAARGRLTGGEPRGK